MVMPLFNAATPSKLKQNSFWTELEESQMIWKIAFVSTLTTLNLSAIKSVAYKSFMKNSICIQQSDSKWTYLKTMW